ncbi:MAG TPA: methylated-DNA--[protein]-cysteine S-methyltransferase [Erysipelotrichaceae bacterium]|nr:methylated-DNA--[protein]-cysteine S-methyltransferase [Erysipelotrichaceae bacterium]
MYVKLFNKTIEVKTDDIGICWVEFCDDIKDFNVDNENVIQKQFTEYEEGARKVFDLPLHIKGTEFQKKVWNALLEIPYGETRSYQEIAIQIGNPKAVRAVGGACNRNPIGIIVPCHRVVGKNGSLTGYAGGLDYKKLLLEKEKMG